MIRVIDSLLLASTKLKSRRTRLIVTVVVSGLLFVGLFLVSFIFNGSMNSIEKFGEDGFGKRYISKLETNFEGDFKLFTDPEVVALAKQADKALIAAKTAEAKRVGLEYDPKTEQLSVDEANKGPGGEVFVAENYQTKSIFRQKRIENSKAFFEAVESAAAEYKIKSNYHVVTLSGAFNGPPSQDAPTLSLIKDGKELEQDQSNFNPYISTGFGTIAMGLNSAEASLLSTFVLPGQNLEPGADGSLPLIAPISAAEEALGLGNLPETASSRDKLDRLKEIREKAAGLQVQICIRNGSSISRQQEAKQQTVDIEHGKTQKDYVKPELIFARSDKPCQDVVVSRDVRSAEAKATALKQEAFDVKFGKSLPSQRLVSFRIVGVAPDQPDFSGFSVTSILSGLLTSNMGSGWYVPLEMRSQLPEFEPIFADVGVINSYSNSTLLEFESADETRRFANEKSCKLDAFSDPFSAMEQCRKKGTPFFLSSFGSNSVAMESAKRGFRKGFRVAALVVSAISVIIMMGTVGKVIADSRRETAVFRAIGAKRLDIAQVYMLYALMLGLVVVVFAALAGWGLASLAQSRYSADLTVDALTAFNSTDLTRKFTLVGFDKQQLLTLVGFMLGGALLSSFGPLLANLKRNPIKDMRDER